MIYKNAVSKLVDKISSVNQQVFHWMMLKSDANRG